MNEFETIVDSMPETEANKAWLTWLRTHDIGKVNPEDILIDTGKGENGSFRRYRINKSKMHLIIRNV